MDRIIKYTVLFISVTFLQLFLFDNINITTYIRPFIFVAFIVLLPMETKGWILLLLAFLSGAIVDLCSGTGGIATISTLVIAFIRPAILAITAGKDEIKDSGIPSVSRLGNAKFMKYVNIEMLIFTIVYFSIESLSLKYFYIILLRALLSTVVSVALLWVCQMFLIGGKQQNQQEFI